MWKTDEGLYMLKVKKKFMPSREFEQYELLNCALIFKQYCLTTEDDKLIQGYYCKLQTDDITFDQI